MRKLQKKIQLYRVFICDIKHAYFSPPIFSA